MKVGQVLKEQQPDVHKQLIQNGKQNKKKHGRGKKESLSFCDFENMMKHESYKRGKGGALRQK